MIWKRQYARGGFTPARDSAFSQSDSRAFLDACQSGNLSALTELLARDATAWADGGGKVHTVPRPIFGREAVARFFLGLARQLPVGLTTRIEEVNGASSLLGWNEAHLEWVLLLDIRDDQIQNLRAMLNPDKLAFIHQQLQPAADQPHRA